jgi:general secretion pathway protein M
MSKLKATLAQYRAGAEQFWQARTEQERKFLSVGGAVLALALAYAVLVAPAMEGRTKLRRELPELRQQEAELQALALQAAALKGQPSVAPPAMTRDSLTASLAGRSLTAQSVAITGEYARLQLNNVSYPGLVDWLATQRRDGRLTVEEAVFNAQSTPGQVDATLTLHQAAGGAQ